LPSTQIGFFSVQAEKSKKPDNPKNIMKSKILFLRNITLFQKIPEKIRVIPGQTFISCNLANFKETYYSKFVACPAQAKKISSEVREILHPPNGCLLKNFPIFNFPPDTDIREWDVE